MARTARLRPVDSASDDWPDVPLEDPLAEIARRFVLRLLDVMDGRSVRSVAEQAGLHHSTLDAVLQGKVWPDLATIGRLELALSSTLYWNLQRR
ncbi:hypothetical protein [Curtobacterium luteum]|uniref:hypothetical protein n=1 Tax=Curtobacterium luteum TaxID=33881 RepID=UPI0038094244